MLTRDVIEGSRPPAAPPAPPRHRWWHASPAGLVVGTTFAALAMTPSLIPRDRTFQGIASGISAAIGYGVGAGGMAAVRWWRRRGSRGPGPLERLRERLGRRGRPVARTGPPGFSSLWSSLVARRDPGAREVAPVYAGGLVVRFAQRPGDEQRPAAPWLDPVVTFWQVSTDLARAQAPPDGHGHNHGDELVDAWVAVAAPDGWGEQDTARLHEVFER